MASTQVTKGSRAKDPAIVAEAQQIFKWIRWAGHAIAGFVLVAAFLIDVLL